MNILEKIVERKKERLPRLKREHPVSSMERSIGAVRPFFKADDITLITECKKGSPSKGVMVEDYNPVKIASAYEAGGSDAFSVLTEEDFFFGRSSDLVDIRSSCSRPVLRKDFIFDEYQVHESHAMGADALLLIAAILDDIQMKDLYDAATAYGLSVLAEAHDEHEVERILYLDKAAVGVNARDLRDFSVDLTRIASIKAMIPKDRYAIAESGIKKVEDALMLRNAGYNGFLIGELFVREKDPTHAVKEFATRLRGRS